MSDVHYVSYEYEVLLKLSCENCLQVKTPTRWTVRRLSRGPSCCRNTWRMSRKSCRLCTPCRLWWCRWSSLPVSSSFLTAQFYTVTQKKLLVLLILYIAFQRIVALWQIVTQLDFFFVFFFWIVIHLAKKQLLYGFNYICCIDCTFNPYFSKSELLHGHCR